MPPLHSALHKISQFEYGITLDFVSWFNQFYLHDDVSNWFGVRMKGRGHGRGATWWRYTRLPMGWCWAPAIAQRVVKLLLRMAGIPDSNCVVWVDNVFLGASTKEAARELLDKLTAVCASVSALFRIEMEGSKLVFLGF